LSIGRQFEVEYDKRFSHMGNGILALYVFKLHAGIPSDSARVHILLIFMENW